MAKTHFRILFVLVALFGCFMVGSVRALTHIVGGSHGWRVPDNKTYFDEWAKPRAFGVGDKLGEYIYTPRAYEFFMSYFILVSQTSKNKQTNKHNPISFLAYPKLYYRYGN